LALRCLWAVGERASCHLFRDRGFVLVLSLLVLPLRARFTLQERRFLVLSRAAPFRLAIRLFRAWLVSCLPPCRAFFSRPWLSAPARAVLWWLRLFCTPLLGCALSGVFFLRLLAKPLRLFLCPLLFRFVRPTGRRRPASCSLPGFLLCRVSGLGPPCFPVVRLALVPVAARSRLAAPRGRPAVLPRRAGVSARSTPLLALGSDLPSPLKHRLLAR